MPGYGGTYHLNGSHPLPTVPGAASIGPNGMPVSQPGNYYQHHPSSSYPQYSPLSQQGQMPPPMMDNPNLVSDFTSQPNVSSPQHFRQPSSQQVSPVQDMSATMDQSSTLGSAGNNSFDASFIDPNDPSLFNFNISDLNFGNHYGALEFGMLGHLATGAVNTPDPDVVTSMGQSNQGSISYDGSTSYPSNYGYNQQFQPWQNVADSGSRQGSTTNLWALQHSGMDAFAVGEYTGSMTGTSPHSSSKDLSAGYSSHTVSPETQFAQPEHAQQPDLLRQSMPQRSTRKSAPFPIDVNQLGLKKRRRDTSEIYASVTSPYPYTQGFHNLIALLEKRFPKWKMTQIAKALSNIRPSFISCNMYLNHDDLIFMEKSFQRMLLEVEELFTTTGTPSLVCRRSGEIATVNKEFSLVTGWSRDVLVGKAPNLNINFDSKNSGTQTGSSTRGAATPRMPHTETDPGRPQPVFLAEVMDEDAICQFYDDFSELAFGATRTSTTRNVDLLKYKTKDTKGWRPEDRFADDGTHIKPQSNVKNEPLIKGEAGMNALGEKEGRVECMMTWFVRQDIFDIPALIVMNVSLQHTAVACRILANLVQFLPVI